MSQVSQIIYQQLGASRFEGMTGATKFLYGEKSLSFRVPSRSSKDGGNFVRVTLLPNDTYRIEYLRIPSLRAKDGTPIVLDDKSEIYVEQLRRTFTNMTNLLTSL